MPTAIWWSFSCICLLAPSGLMCSVSPIMCSHCNKLLDFMSKQKHHPGPIYFEEFHSPCRWNLLAFLSLIIPTLTYLITWDHIQKTKCPDLKVHFKHRIDGSIFLEHIWVCLNIPEESELYMQIAQECAYVLYWFSTAVRNALINPVAINGKLLSSQAIKIKPGLN